MTRGRGRARRVLVFGHASAAAAGVAVARDRLGATDVDVTSYGRAARDAPLPEGARGAGNLGGGGAEALRLLWCLRRTRYDAVIVAQPGLLRSRARGALLGFAAAVGAPVRLAIDPASTGVAEFSRRRAVADARRFVTGQLASALVASVAAVIVERVPGRRARPVPAEGAVLYLRTDLDLALAPLTAGGSLAHTAGVLDALRRRGFAVEVHSTGPMDGIEAGELPAVVRPNMPWEIAELLSGFVQAAALRRRRGAAFVYQRYSANNLAGVLLARIHGVPLVLEANASEVTWRAEWSTLNYPRLAKATERLVLASSDRVAVVSRNAAHDLVAAGADPERLRYVPNGVDLQRFAGAAPARLPFEPGSFVVAFSGLFYPWHGARFLAEAFVELRRIRPSARLLLVGDGEEQPLARAILERGGALQDAHLTGLAPRASVPGLLAAADVLATPHVRNDGFIGSPIKLWEYMAAGRAIVASDVAQIGEVLEHERTALVLPPEDVGALTEALARLHDDEALRRRLGEAARREAELHHSWDARLADLLEGRE